MIHTKSKPPAPARPHKQDKGKVRQGKPAPSPNAVDEAVAALRGKPPYRRWTADRLKDAVIEAICLRGADDPNPKDTLDGWLLTGLTLDQIAPKTGLPIDTVSVYAARYLDVAGRLRTADDREALAWELFGAQGLFGFPAEDTRRWKRYIGLTCGEEILAIYLDYLRAGPLVVPADLMAVSDAELQRLQVFLRMRIWTLGDTSHWTDAQKRRFEVVVARREYLGV